jgi:hypothetical protein
MWLRVHGSSLDKWASELWPAGVVGIGLGAWFCVLSFGGGCIIWARSKEQNMSKMGLIGAVVAFLILGILGYLATR